MPPHKLRQNRILRLAFPPLLGLDNTKKCALLCLTTSLARVRSPNRATVFVQVPQSGTLARD